MKQQKRVQTKIHCRHCGKMRQGKLAFLNGSIEKGDTDKEIQDKISFFRTRKFFEVLRYHPEVPLPSILIGHCPHCFTNTHYVINENRKLEVLNVD